MLYNLTCFFVAKKNKIGYNIIGGTMVIKYLYKNGKQDSKISVVEFLLYLLINTLVLMLASVIFKDFYIESFWIALLASVIIIILNKTLKPFVILFTLPLTILTIGIFYPFINVFILKITSLIIGKKFIVDGWMVPFFITLFISVTNYILEQLITKPIIERRKNK